MVSKEKGQALLLVLIILAIGTLMIVPALRLTQTSLKGIQVINRRSQGLYLAGAAQELIMWMLYYGTLTDNMTQDGDKVYLNLNVCDAEVSATVTMRAVEAPGGICLITDDVIRPTRTVSPDTVPVDTYQSYTYTIRMEQLSDNTTRGLDAVYDILPDEFASSDYVAGSSELRVDGGSWQSIDDPLVEVDQNQVRLRWPNPNTYGSENFTSPMRDFTTRQVKEIRFQVASTLGKNNVYCNWVVLKPWNTLSGAQAPITVGSPSNPGECAEDGLLQVDKVADPELILPDVETDVKYVMSITNLDGFTQQIQSITDYLPGGFFYTDNSTSGNVTDINPQLSTETVCEEERQKLLWTTAEFPGGNAVALGSGETVEMVFWARTTKDVSGSYFNQFTVVPNVPVPKIFENIGVTEEEWNTTYSWNSGTVIVPAYDSETSADGENVTANFGLDPEGVTINSWTIK